MLFLIKRIELVSVAVALYTPALSCQFFHMAPQLSRF